MADLIVIAGSPGSGKHTVAAHLRDRLGFPPHVDLGRIREFHLDREWKLANNTEEEMSFKTLEFMTRHYLENGYKNIIITDLQDFRVQKIPEYFKRTDYYIFSLVVTEDAELKKRIQSRTEGFTNVEDAVEWNKNLQERETVKNEFRLDNTHNDPEQTVERIMEMLEG